MTKRVQTWYNMPQNKHLLIKPIKTHQVTSVLRSSLLSMCCDKSYFIYTVWWTLLNSQRQFNILQLQLFSFSQNYCSGPEFSCFHKKPVPCALPILRTEETNTHTNIHTYTNTLTSQPNKYNNSTTILGKTAKPESLCKKLLTKLQNTYHHMK